MMKRCKYLLLILLATLLLPNYAYATSDAVGNGEQGRGVKNGACLSTWMCQAIDAAGVRFTFVDQTGAPVSGSYDFTTKTNGGYRNMVYNAGTGDKSKLTGKFTKGSTNIADLPKLSTLAGKMNWYMNTYDEYRSGKVASIKFSGDTGGNRYNMYKTETTWFTSMTLRGLDKETYTANVNAFMVALQDVYSDFNAEEMKMQMIEGCNSGQEIYIQMEPLYTVFYGGDNRLFVFGSIRDIVTYYEGRGLGAAARNYLNGTTNKFLWAIEYDRRIDASNFTGYEPATSGSGFKLESIESLNARVGYAVALDWANSPDGYCDQCVYKDGQMYFEDQLVSSYAPPFKSLEEYALSPRSKGGMNCCNALDTELKEGRKLPAQWQNAYDRYCKKPEACSKVTYDDETVYYCPDGKECPDYMYEELCNDDSCCELDPIEKGHIEGNINNCCADGTISEAHEYDLDDLFCDANGLGVKNFKEKCDADYYEATDTKLEDEYCKMYCTERVSVEIPGALTAISGRYFKLAETSKGTKSAYIEGYKRCRVVIQYQAWEEDYVSTVENQIESYNKFQEDKANELMYEDAIKTEKSETKTSNITCGCSCNSPVRCQDGSTGCSEVKSASASGSCEIKYNKYTFSKMYDINTVDIDTTKRDGEKKIFDAVEIVHRASYKTSHEAWSAWDIDASIEACNQKVKSMEKKVTPSGANCSCTLSCNRTTVEAENHKEDVKATKDKFAESTKSDNDAFNANAGLAKNLEETIDRCTKYFTKYEGANAKENYKFDAKQNFSYTQVYMDDNKKLTSDEIEVKFAEDPGCVVDDKVTLGPDEADKLRDKQYSSTVYGEGVEKMSDFKNSTLEYQKDKNGFKSYIDETYEADKVFTTDAKYHATCSWDEGDNTLYTLVPNGSASEETSEMNYTLHEHEYRVYLTTLDGTYETYWNLRGLGSKIGNTEEGKFDEYFLNAGETCAKEDPNETAMLTCKIHSEHEVVLTGYCNGSNGTDTTIDPEDCDPYKEGYQLFNFKVVDPANLFPSGTYQGGESVAYNWTSTEAGQKAMKEIQETGAKDMTYAPENLTYSFILTPNDMNNIKKYNAEQYQNGGYSDFTLICSKQSCEAGACDQCKSPFLENLANGNIRYNSVDHKATGWANPDRDLAAVRRYYGWN